MGQAEIAKSLGVTSQQVQKYECGTNRVSASRLYDLAEILGVQVSYFFEVLPSNLDGKSVAERSDMMTKPVLLHEDVGRRHGAMELMRSFYGIEDERLRESLFELIKSVSSYDDRRSE